MAESITEGTLKQFTKRKLSPCTHRVVRSMHSCCLVEVGEYVAQDEELATIETDKVSLGACTSVELD